MELILKKIIFTKINKLILTLHCTKHFLDVSQNKHRTLTTYLIMPKLTTSVNKDENQNNEKNISNFSLSTKVEKKDTDNSTQNDGQQTTKLGQSTKVQSVSSVSDVAQWLISLTGIGVFDDLKNNPHLQLPYTEDDLATKEWLEKAMKTIFTKENLKEISNQIQANQQKISELAQVAQKAEAEKKEMLEKYNRKFQELKEEVENAEDDKFQAEKELNTAVPISMIISEFYRDPEDKSDELKKIIGTLHEAMEQKDDSVGRFILRFSKGWFVLKNTLKTLGNDEKENLDKVHDALTELLAFISNTYISERRPLLDIVAKMCSKEFTSYDFISPEQTLQPDPEIHDASGVGNSTIKEGVTFAVVRKESRKAVKYAEIKVN